VDCRDARKAMHVYFDGDTAADDLAALKRHVASCPACRDHFRQLRQTAALIRSLPAVGAPVDLRGRILEALPPGRTIAASGQASGRMRWVRRHPGLSAAMLFAVVMAASYAVMWGHGNDVVVRARHPEQVVVEGNRVVVPAGKAVAGDLIVENAEVAIDGEVKGDLVVVDGTYHLASTAHIAGKVLRIDRALEWIWYRIETFFQRK